MKNKLIATLAVLLVGGAPAAAPASGDAAPVAIAKPDRDLRDYRYLLLPNRLRVVLVSDPTSDKAAAALDVRVGSRHEPEARAGLAHFLEHMLFLGTGKYPEPGAYQRYIQEHGGSNNASTSFENTNYYFEIDSGQLRGALDRFAQFFVAPLFSEAYVERERHAVHSEYQTRLNDDSSRAWDAMKQTFNPDHPASRFSVGSLDTLSDDGGGRIRDALVDFWKREYSANRMTLSVYGVESLDELEAWVRESFEAVEDRGLPTETDRVAVPLFRPDGVPRLLRVVPERELRSLRLDFPVPPVSEHFRSKPAYYLSNLLGHEGAGSLLSELKAKGWSDGLSSGLQFGTRDAAMFGVSIKLTEAGLAAADEVAGHVFEYLDLMRRGGVAPWRIAELQRLLALGFEFREPDSPVEYVVDLARAMHLYPPEEIVRGPYLLSEPDPALLERYLAALRPDNALVILLAAGQETDARSPRFDAPYAVAPLPAEWLAAWRAPAPNPALALPAPNVFVPESLALKPESSPRDRPTAVRSDPGFELWFDQDPSFEVPKANVYLSVRSPRANDSPRSSVLTSLYTGLVRDQLQEFSYPADLAGLSYELYRHRRGFTLRVSGFDDKIDVLVEHVARTLRAPVLDPERFALQKAEVARRLTNRAKDRSFRLAAREGIRMLLDPSWSEAERLAALAPLELADLRAFVPALLERVDVTTLAHGNLAEGEARALAEIIEDTIVHGATPVKVGRGRVVKLAGGEQVARRIEVAQADSAISLYVQGRSRLLRERARFALLEQLVSIPFYQELRTEQQLGYVVYASGAVLFEVPALSFVIQSPRARPAELEIRIRAFLSDFARSLESMPAEVFEQHRRGLLSKVLEKDRTLQDRSNRYWRELSRRRLEFDSREQLADVIRSLGAEEMSEFYRAAVLGGDSRQLVVHALGTSHRGEGDDPGEVRDGVGDVAAFRAAREVFFPE